MEPHENDELLATLKEMRPEPRPGFAEELDARAAAGFPRRSRLAATFDRLRATRPRRVLLPAGAVALTVVAVATVVVWRDSGEVQLNMGAPHEVSLNAVSADEGAPIHTPRRAPLAEQAENAAAGSSAGMNFDRAGPYMRASSAQAGTNLSLAPDARKRKIERSTAIVLGTEPEDVGKASSEVFGVVHDSRGIVLNSRTRDGAAGRAEASFELMIPSGKLGDAMAGFSQIGEVRSRQEATVDITAPTVSTAEKLEDSQARIDSLLAQLAEAESEGEREAVEAELRGERRKAAALRTQLQSLDRRASLSRVSLRIVGREGTAPDAGGAWGVGDALDDAGRILAVGAGVALLALTVLAPLALIALLAWLARRTYLRRARQSALG